MKLSTSTMLLLSKTLPYVRWDLVTSTLKVLKMIGKNLTATITYQVGRLFLSIRWNVLSRRTSILKVIDMISS